MPSLAEMREKLRAGMTHGELFLVLDDLADEGLRFSLPTASKDVISLPVADGGELLCFIKERLEYVEYQGGTFIELAPE